MFARKGRSIKNQQVLGYSKIGKKGFLMLFLANACLFSNCTSITTEKTYETSKMLGNQRRIVVEKTKSITTYKGIITKNDYGTTQRYRYNFTIDNNDIDWKGRSGVPKNILFCKDSVYVRYLVEKEIKEEQGSTADSSMSYTYTSVIRPVHEVFVDKRYFFRLFGYTYWVEVPPETYMDKQSSCQEYAIPNDNELSLPALPEKDL